jgi:hypothetical protein
LISILVPFQADRGSDRKRIWKWTKRYWKHALPGCEIVVGQDGGRPFSKTSAVNNAASRARGDIYVILDADCLMAADVIEDCARRIREAAERGQHLWFVPYRRMFRLSPAVTDGILESNPRRWPFWAFELPQDPGDVVNADPPSYGHHFGALVQVMPAEAFWHVGGMDGRFRAWGGEDVSFLFALDTLWGPHRSMDNEALHLWHETIGATWQDRMWEGQDRPMPMHALASRYSAARGDRARMRALVKEHCGRARTKSWREVREQRRLMDLGNEGFDGANS